MSRGDIERHVRELETGDAHVAAAALEALWRLINNYYVAPKPNCVAIREAGGIPPLVAIVRNGPAGGQEKAAWLLSNLAETTSRTAPGIKWLLGAGSLALPNELIREILEFWRATPIHAWYPSWQC